MQRQLHVIALAQLRNHHFDVLLPRAAQQKFLRLRIARKAQRQVLFENLVDGDADAILVRARLRLDGESDRGLRNPRARVIDSGALLSPSVSPVTVSFSLATAPMSPACSSFTAVGRLALHHLHVLQALRRIAVEILQRRRRSSAPRTSP